jgi:hypothetical protein
MMEEGSTCGLHLLFSWPSDFSISAFQQHSTAEVCVVLDNVFFGHSLSGHLQKAEGHSLTKMIHPMK